MKTCNIDDFCALESDCLLLSIMYARIKATQTKRKALLERINFLRNLILKK